MSFSGRCFTQIIGEEEGRPIYLFSTDSPLRSMTGDFEGMAFYAGNGVDKIDAIIPAGERLWAIVTTRLLQGEADGARSPASG